MKKNRLEYLKHPRGFIEYSNKMQDIYKNIEKCNQSRKFTVLIVFGDMIPDKISNKMLSTVVTEIFIRGRKLYISTAFIHNLIYKYHKILN